MRKTETSQVIGAFIGDDVMITSHSFAERSAPIASSVMQAYIVVMVILVVAGILFDVLHKNIAKHCRANIRSGSRC